ncbi:MAG: histidine kinase [endosymbiont of Galathealinum brachiosum]|uniref:Histidine kinase n=1 Tax=endosymbiont of Galathealinum brachiosum TaxID=2200906 RepID=A0A370DAF3_9GAMM|nr:MAG: histidine kinase [endosymbiont of Galathealinum brachiosum]
MSSPSTEPDMNEAELTKLIRNYNIPPQPHILAEIQNADDNLNTIADIISQDVALSSGLLQTINSSYYGLANHITSIQQAAMLLGLKAVKNIVNCQLLHAQAGNYQNKDLSDFWQTANDVANTAATLVHILGFGSTDEAYTLGLFHNCGIPILMDKHEDYLATIQSAYNATDKRITQIENENYSTNHAVLGYMVSRAWKLPEHLRIAIRDHHNFERLSFKQNDYSTEADTILAILKMSEHISHVHAVLGKDHEDNEWKSIKTGIFDFLGISEPDFEDISDSVIEKLNMY